MIYEIIKYSQSQELQHYEGFVTRLYVLYTSLHKFTRELEEALGERLTLYLYCKFGFINLDHNMVDWAIFL